MKRIALTLGVVIVLLVASFGTASAITNGQPDGEAHPYIGLLVFDAPNASGVVGPAWRCTGTLISPTVVLTAGHCTDGAVAARVWFDAQVTDPMYPFGGGTSIEGMPYTDPDFCIGCGNGLPGFDSHDVGVVVLSEAVTDRGFGVLPAEGMVDTLKMNTEIWSVGYGVQMQLRGGGPPVWTGSLTRFFAPSNFINSNDVLSDMFLKLSANPGQDKGGTCFGDSGGPNLLGGTNIILGVNSFVTNSNCTGVTYSNRVDKAYALDFIYGFLGD
ncbi:MAG: S1 family peptidase [Chloroflexi bacterium]|nr:S1 family peptidase [Chloroflexota bacterium]